MKKAVRLILKINIKMTMCMGIIVKYSGLQVLMQVEGLLVVGIQVQLLLKAAQIALLKISLVQVISQSVDL